MVRCEERAQRNCEPPGNQSPWAKASGIPARRKIRLLPWVFTFPNRVGVGGTDRKDAAAKTRRRQGGGWSIL